MLIQKTSVKLPTNPLRPSALIMAGVVLLISACVGTGSEIRSLSGRIESPLPPDSAPAQVLQNIADAVRFHEHDILSDPSADISVFSLDEVDTPSGQLSTEGFGIVVMKGTVSTLFPNIRNSRQPQANYDPSTRNLWLTASAMSGTGVQVERLYQIRFHENDSAYIACIADPYDIQQTLLQRLGYRIDDRQITLYDNGRQLFTATSSLTDMGAFDSDSPLWIGEQLSYDLSLPTPYLQITPGVKYTTGLVLTYDDMPTLSAPISLDSLSRVTIGTLECEL